MTIAHILSRFSLLGILLLACVTSSLRIKAGSSADRAAIERVYQQHRLESQGLPGATLTDSALRRLVMRDQLKENLLERRYKIVVSKAQVQAEARRIDSTTQAPHILTELKAALGDDAERFAQAVVRPIIVDRELRKSFNDDHALQRTRLEILENFRLSLMRSHHRTGGLEELRALAECNSNLNLSEVTWLFGSASFVEQSRYEALKKSSVNNQQKRSFNELDPQIRSRIQDELRKAGDISSVVADPKGFAFYIARKRTTELLETIVISVPDQSYDGWLDQVDVTLAPASEVLSRQDEREEIGKKLGPIPAQASTGPALLNSPASANDVWSKRAGGTRNSRHNHTAVWTGTEMIVWGGGGFAWSGNTAIGYTYLNDGERYNPALNIWTPVSTTGAPSGRLSHSAVWTGTEMIIWGGQNATLLNDGARYNPATDTWMPIPSTGAPAARPSFSTVWTGSEMIIWGGAAYNNGVWQGFNTGGRYDPVSNTWIPTSTSGAPTPGGTDNPQVAVWAGTEMIVWVGTGWRYNPASDLWTRTSSIGTTAFYQSGVWTGTEVVFWGNTSPFGDHKKGNRYNPQTDTWRSMTDNGAPSLRNYASVVWTGTEMIVWGGYDGDSLQDGARYYPATDNWAATSPSGSPHSRYGHTAVWTGSEMIVWGGFYIIKDSNGSVIGGDSRDDGSRYSFPAQWDPKLGIHVT